MSTHSLGWTLAYSIAVPAAAFLFALFFMPETRHMKIWDNSLGN